MSPIFMIGIEFKEDAKKIRLFKRIMSENYNSLTKNRIIMYKKLNRECRYTSSRL